MAFKEIKTAISEQFEKMSKQELFKVDLTGDYMWETYLDSFPPGTNPIFKERTEHDCTCCRQFIKACGGVVTIEGNRMVSLWDVVVPEPYQTVCNALSQEVKRRFVSDVFRYREANVGTDFNRVLLEREVNVGTETEKEKLISVFNRVLLENEEVARWEHFYFKLPTKFVSTDPGSELAEFRARKQVLKRGLEEITVEAVEIVLELIDQNSLYRGQEFRPLVELFQKHKTEFDKIKGLEKKDLYFWKTSMALGSASGIRNTVIGTLLCDISDGMELDKAVKSFESKVAPANYKRPSALITKTMIKKAQEKVEALGITSALTRRYAVAEDLTINNVLFANREAKKAMNAFDELADEVPHKGNFDKVEGITVGSFMKDVLPKVDSVELFVENKHSNNLMSLIAPVDPEAKHIFKWDNNFSWAYNGDVTDLIKERVKAAGGNVEGVLRYSLSWFNHDDLDAWCQEPDGNKISFHNAKRIHRSTGVLDVDMNAGSGITRKPVENITWSKESRMQEGVYKIWVNQYQSRENSNIGFDAELEYDGKIYSFHYAKKQRTKENVVVAEFIYSKAEGVKIIKSLPSTQVSKEVWGIPTQTFRKVSMILNSPNHWDDMKIGNKHWFFILDGCKNDKTARGFFNEFLNEDLREHRKVFEVLGSKMKTEKSDNQLSGLGFSSTQRNQVLCKVSGSFNRMLKVTF